MSMNSRLAAVFEEIAQLLELTGADSFRASANARAARVIADYPEDVSRLASDRDRLLEIEGVGPKIADKIQEFARTGAIAEHRALLEQVPAGLLDVLRVPGVGPKTVRSLWECAGVTCLDDLKMCIETGSILEIPRMGKKTVENLRRAIEFSAKTTERAPLGVAAMVAEALLARLREMKGVRRAEAAGSLRRGRDTIGDVDLIASVDDPVAVAAAFRAMPEVEEVLAAGETKTSVRIRTFAQGSKSHTMQVDLRIVPLDSFGAALLYFTGSKDHNIRLRERALKQKLTLNEYGLYPLDKEKTPPQQRGVRAVASTTEEDVYRALGLPWIPPEIREDRGEFERSADSAPLVEVAEIKAELHAHTTASDGLLSIIQLAEAAKARGFHTVAVTDHSKSQVIARGLSRERLVEHVAAIREADEAVSGIRILAGAEVDILADGSLDYDDEALAMLDIVVASPHWALTQEPAAATRRIVRAASHPLVHILGHPTGRLINRRQGLSPDMAEVIAAAVEHGAALEINAHWARLDLRDAHVRQAVDAGALIAVNCDVHDTVDFDNLRLGVVTARRGWTTSAQCVNTWPAPELHAWLARKRSGSAPAPPAAAPGTPAAPAPKRRPSRA